MVKLWAEPNADRVLEDVVFFLAVKAADLIRLMFAALCGRYVVSLFQTSKDNRGYVLFIVVSAVVLIRLADHAVKREDRAH